MESLDNHSSEPLDNHSSEPLDNHSSEPLDNHSSDPLEDDPEELLKKIRQAPNKLIRIKKYMDEGICPSEVVRAMVCVCGIANKKNKAICGILITFSDCMEDQIKGFDVITQPVILDMIVRARMSDKKKIKLLSLASLLTEPQKVKSLVDERKFAQIYIVVKFMSFNHQLDHQ